jgi:hypothetical protein
MLVVTKCVVVMEIWIIIFSGHVPRSMNSVQVGFHPLNRPLSPPPPRHRLWRQNLEKRRNKRKTNKLEKRKNK